MAITIGYIFLLQFGHGNFCRNFLVKSLLISLFLSLSFQFNLDDLITHKSHDILNNDIPVQMTNLVTWPSSMVYMADKLTPAICIGWLLVCHTFMYKKPTKPTIK